jgi:hypothetical protein
MQWSPAANFLHASLLGSEQHGMFTAACVRGIAEYLTGIVESDSVGKREPGAGRN